MRSEVCSGVTAAEKAPESSACGTMCTAPMWVFTKQPWSKVMVLLSAMKSTQLNGHGDTHRKLFLAKALPSNQGAGCSMGTQRPARRPIHRLRPLFHTICVNGFRWREPLCNCIIFIPARQSGSASPCHDCQECTLYVALQRPYKLIIDCAWCDNTMSDNANQSCFMLLNRLYMVL